MRRRRILEPKHFVFEIMKIPKGQHYCRQTCVCRRAFQLDVRELIANSRHWGPKVGMNTFVEEPDRCRDGMQMSTNVRVSKPRLLKETGCMQRSGSDNDTRSCIHLHSIVTNICHDPNGSFLSIHSLSMYALHLCILHNSSTILWTASIKNATTSLCLSRAPKHVYPAVDVPRRFWPVFSHVYPKISQPSFSFRFIALCCSGK
jgi:hypothetical protein